MPSKLEFRFSVVALLLVASAAPAQSPSTMLDRLTADACMPFVDTSTEALQDRLDGQEDSALASLLIDAVVRQCAALGAISPPERPGEEGTRSTSPMPDTDGAARLAAEARYLVETATQIDPDAANDLLRRLLGPGREDEG